jgi:hypothetical protein
MVELDRELRAVRDFHTRLSQLFEDLLSYDPRQRENVIYANAALQTDEYGSVCRLAKQIVKYGRHIEEQRIEGFIENFKPKNPYIKSLFDEYLDMWRSCSTKEHRILEGHLRELLLHSKIIHEYK